MSIKINKIKEYCLSVGSEFLSLEYNKGKDLYKFKCTECGVPFERSFDKFKNAKRTRCIKCSRKSMSRPRKNTYDVVKKFVEDKSKCELISIEHKKVTIKKHKFLNLKCSCGEYFSQIWEVFKDSKFKVCPKCSSILKAKERALNIEDVEEEIISYGLKLESEYKNIDADIILKCTCGRDFITSLYKVRQSIYKTCKMCDSIRSSNRQAFTHEEFLEKANKLSDIGEYEFISEYHRSSSKIKIKHLECNKIFSKTPNNFLGYDARCPYCKSKFSSGERAIINFLEKNNVKYTPQKTFSGCKNKTQLPFDFYLLDYNILLEFQGELHEERLRHSHFGSITKQTKTDLIKQKFCRENKIKLIHIWHFEKHQICKILKYLLKR